MSYRDRAIERLEGVLDDCLFNEGRQGEIEGLHTAISHLLVLQDELTVDQEGQ